jgi:hypothetical protein
MAVEKSECTPREFGSARLLENITFLPPQKILAKSYAWAAFLRDCRKELE